MRPRNHPEPTYDTPPSPIDELHNMLRRFPGEVGDSLARSFIGSVSNELHEARQEAAGRLIGIRKERLQV